MSLVWLWDAGRWSGMADTDRAAVAAAEACITAGDADTATVEVARQSLTLQLEPTYKRTGTRWTARRDGDGVSWADLPGRVPYARRTAPCPR